jgi:hypothetical protein
LLGGSGNGFIEPLLSRLLDDATSSVGDLDDTKSLLSSSVIIACNDSNLSIEPANDGVPTKLNFLRDRRSTLLVGDILSDTGDVMGDDTVDDGDSTVASSLSNVVAMVFGLSVSMNAFLLRIATVSTPKPDNLGRLLCYSYIIN